MGYGGGTLCPILCGIPGVLVQNEVAVPMMVFAWSLSSLGAVEAFLLRNPIGLAILSTTFEVFRCQVMMGCAAMAVANLQPPKSYPVATVGPLICGMLGGIGGGFMPLSVGLEPPQQWAQLADKLGFLLLCLDARADGSEHPALPRLARAGARRRHCGPRARRRCRGDVAAPSHYRAAAAWDEPSLPGQGEDGMSCSVSCGVSCGVELRSRCLMRLKACYHTTERALRRSQTCPPILGTSLRSRWICLRMGGSRAMVRLGVAFSFVILRQPTL